MMSRHDTRTCLLDKWTNHVPICQRKFEYVHVVMVLSFKVHERVFHTSLCAEMCTFSTYLLLLYLLSFEL